jgi:hypothetical protein
MRPLVDRHGEELVLTEGLRALQYPAYWAHTLGEMQAVEAAIQSILKNE